MKKLATYLYLLKARTYTYMSYLRVLALAIALVSFLVMLLQGEAHMYIHMQVTPGSINGLSGWLDKHDPWD